MKSTAQLIVSQFFKTDDALEAGAKEVVSISTALKAAKPGFNCVRREILSNMDAATGSEMSNFCHYYSRVIFRNIDLAVYFMWLDFLGACKVFQSYEFTPQQLDEAATLYKRFLDKYNRFFYTAIPFNFHQLLHLPEHMMDTGPAISTWG